MPAADIPTFLKHVTVAIYDKGYGSGSREQRFFHSFDVARWKLVEWGYARQGSQYGPPDNIKLTSKGMRKESQHKRDKGSKQKDHHFDLLYELIESAVEELPMEEEEGVPETRQRNDPAAYRERMQVRRAAAAAASPRPQKSKRTKKARTPRARRARARRARRRS